MAAVDTCDKGKVRLVGCAFCGDEKSNLQRCSRCKCTFYCSREHQKLHWKEHKVVCVLQDDHGDLKQNDLANLANFIGTSLKEKWFCVIDGFLVKDKANEVYSCVDQLYKSGQFKDGELSGGLSASEKSEKYSEPRIRGDKLLWVEGNETEKLSVIRDFMNDVDALITKCSELRVLENYTISGRTKVMAACYPGNGARYIRHVDNPDDDGRCLTVIYYLNPKWLLEDGGVLRIYREGNGKIDIEPLFNRLLIFWSDNRNPHEVLPAFANRYAVTMWYFDSKRREMAMEKHREMKISQLLNQDENIMHELTEKKAERDKAKLKLDRESEKYVSEILSEDEIQALMVLVKEHPDPSTLLANYGITQSIQTALLKLFEKRKETLL